MAFSGIDLGAVLPAAVAGWLFGAVYYGLLGKAWRAALAGPSAMELPPGTARFFLPFVLSFVASIVMAAVLAAILDPLGAGQTSVGDGLMVGALIWFGFVATTVTVNYVYALRSPLLLLIDCGHWLAVLLIQGAVIGVIG